MAQRVLLVLCVLGLACGIKAPPRPPLEEAPAVAPADAGCCQERRP